METEDDNWLEAEVLACPGCSQALFAVLHSPFCDDYRLHCDRCPRAIDVSFYDPVCAATVRRLAPDRTGETVMAAIEPLLRPCPCGGRFRGDAPRRCFACAAEVPAAAGKDLSPCDGSISGERDPTAEEQAAFDRFEAEFVRREPHWAADQPGEPAAPGPARG